MKRQTYYIKGMHCASCELIIEKKLLAFPGVEFADASLARGEVVFAYRENRPKVNELTKDFVSSGYLFSEQPFNKQPDKGQEVKVESSVLLPALTIIIAFILLERLGLSSLVNVNSSSAWPVFLTFGLIAGLSSCAALVGGLLLSLSKQWQEQLNDYGSRARWEPSLLFNLGRVISYFLLGLALGFVGQKLQFSPAFNSLLLLVVSVLMTVLALQMLGVKALQRFKIALPKSLARRVVSGSSRGHKVTPFIFGFLTFLLPCGFTLMVESLAVLSGSPLRGALMLGVFALGTTIPLMAIGWSSAKLLGNQAKADRFLRIAGILVLFFVAYNLNVQFRFVDLNKLLTRSTPIPTIGQVSTSTSITSSDVQIIKTIYTLRDDIQPNTFTVKKNQPVRFEVDVRDNGQGCMSTIMIRGLYNRPIYLAKGQPLVMEFTPTQTGDYQIACAMGVPRGTIKVVD